jgi:ATP-binding cassette subfamily F protein uup
MLDLEKTVRENMTDSDYVLVKGRSRHVIGYLKDFLFAPERIDSPVKSLSGGERNRLLLAKIFTRSANMIVLDEPTNDLDVDTLELLEDLLADYEGTLLLVSHDRSFLDNVVTSTLVFEGNGKFGEYAGGYEDWERYQRPIPAFAEAQKAVKANPQATAEKEKLIGTSRKLTYKEQRERQSLPDRIEALEAEQGKLHELMGEADFYRQPGDKIAATMERLEKLKGELEACYERWQFLESVAKKASD